MTQTPIVNKKRAISIDKLLKTKFVDMHFDGNWKEALGVPEMSGTWFIWGNSSNGKTSGCLRLAKYLTKFSKVIYNTLEEGARKSMQQAIQRAGIKDVQRRFTLLHKEPMEELASRLQNRKSARIVFIDSFQYWGPTKKEFIRFTEQFPNHLFIFVSHAEGREPAGKVARHVRYHSDVKIFVEGYKMICESRFGGQGEIVVSEERAAKYWGEKTKQQYMPKYDETKSNGDSVAGSENRATAHSKQTGTKTKRTRQTPTEIQ